METDPLPSIFEADLARHLGVDRKVLTEARLAVLTESDLERKKGGLAYFASGVTKVCAHLHLDQPRDLGAEKSPEKKDGAPVLTLRVLRLARHNPRIIFAVALDDTAEIPVRVRAASAFRAGQEIQVRMEGSVAHLHGAQPRLRGQRRPSR